MRRRVLVALAGAAAALAVLAALAAAAGLTPAFVRHGPAVAAGMGAKLLCSAEHVTGQARDAARADLAQYSPLLARLRVRHDPQARAVTASLLGLRPATARFRPGLGCAVDRPGRAGRAALRAPAAPAGDAPWPAGGTADAIDPALDALLEAMLAEDGAAGLDTRALLAARGGRLRAEAYAPGVGPATPLLGWSMAKSLTGVMVGNLALRGLLDLKAPAGFAAWAGDGRAAIRVEHLLTMTDGLAFSERYAPGDDATAMLFTAPSPSDYALARPAARPPGVRFNYSSGSANLLARLHHDVLGGGQAALDDYMENVHRPMGFAGAVFETDADGVFVGSSYLYAPARDWARLGQLMLDRGEINGRRLVSAAWADRAVSPNGSENGPAYGYQWWLNRGGAAPRWPELPPDAFAAVGNRGQYLMVVPSRDAVLVRLGWTDGGYPVGERFRRALDALPPGGTRP